MSLSAWLALGVIASRGIGFRLARDEVEGAGSCGTIWMGDLAWGSAAGFLPKQRKPIAVVWVGDPRFKRLDESSRVEWW